MYKKTGILLYLIILSVSCSNFHIKREINNSSALKKLKSPGIIVRIPHNSPFPLRLFNKSLSQWLEPYEKKISLTIQSGTSKNVNLSKAEYDRFLQFSSNNDFQYYQSLGIITLYLKNNREELDNLKSENNLDSIIVYEVDTFLSTEMQVYNFNSMIVIVDNDYQVLYLDHQFDAYDTHEIDRGALRENLLDEVSNRFLELMLKVDYIREK
jgi:hypothetical protein